jgi:hypothetical protein
MITDLLAIENAYINTSHPDFVAAIQDLRSEKQPRLLSSPGGTASQANSTPTRRGASASTSSSSSSSSSSFSSSKASNPAPTMQQLMASANFGSAPLSEREQTEVQWVKQLLIAYFGIVRTNIQDTVPKAIMHLLVNESMKMGQELILKLLTEGDPGTDLLIESEDITARRKTCEQTVEMLQKAKDILSTVRDIVA